MRFLIMAFCAIAGAAHADCTGGGTDGGILVNGWAVDETTFTDTSVAISLENSSPQTIHALDGYILFSDPLGRILSPVSLPRIQVIPPGEFKTYAFGSTGNALMTLPAEQFTSEVCVLRAAYADGTVETFD